MIPLKLPSIEPKPKKVLKAETYKDSIGLSSRRPDLATNLVTIVRCIENGYAIPEEYYRANRHDTPDELLEKLGVMHLHLDHPGCRELLYLVQFDEAVVLLEASDHIHVDTSPRGEILGRTHVLPPIAWKTRQNEQLAASIEKLKRQRQCPKS